MILSKKILLVIAGLSINILSVAQQTKIKSATDNYRAVHWDTEDGLSRGTVECMLKDTKGFLWAGTQYGLNRFDGSRWKNYFADSISSATIIGNNIESIKEDSLHNIWIGTDKGLSRY